MTRRAYGAAPWGPRACRARRHQGAACPRASALLRATDDVKAERALDDRAHLPHVERERRVGKRPNHLVAREPPEIPVPRRAAGLIGVRGHHLVEILPRFDA